MPLPRPLKEIYLHPRSAGRLWGTLRDLPLQVAAEIRDAVREPEFGRLYRAVRPHTMSSKARLRGLYHAVRYAVREEIPGAVVECGTARGGSAALMGLTLQGMNAKRLLWVFDTFEGLPPPTAADPDYEIAKLYTGDCRGELQTVRGLFETYGILPQTRMVPGLFQDTVPDAEVGSIAVLHLDGDWYESVRVCLDHLYDRVSPGGVIQIDDYGHWEGARKAVQEFFVERGLLLRLRYLDYTGRQFIKPATAPVPEQREVSCVSSSRI